MAMEDAASSMQYYGELIHLWMHWILYNTKR